MRQDGDGAAEEFFDVAKLRALLAGAEGDGLAFGPGAAGASDAMDVGPGLVGQVEVDDVRDVVDVEAAGGDVAGHQHARLALLEVVQGPGADVLRFVGVDGLAGDAGPDEPPGDLIGPVLGAGEHERPRHHRVLEQMFEQIELAVLVDVVEDLLDGIGSRGLGRDADFDGMGEYLVGHRLDFPRHGGREHQGLPLLRDLRDDAPDVLDEPHVEHPVGLVEDEYLDRAEGQDALVQQVQEAPRRGDEDIDAFAERLHLVELIDAAEDDGVPQADVLAVNAKTLADLRGQLAGGRDNQGANGPVDVSRCMAVSCGRGMPAVSRHDGMTMKVLQDGQGEGGRLAGARLGAAQQVPSFQHIGDRLLLDGGGDGVAFGLDRAQ